MFKPAGVSAAARVVRLSLFRRVDPAPAARLLPSVLDGCKHARLDDFVVAGPFRQLRHPVTQALDAAGSQTDVI